MLNLLKGSSVYLTGAIDHHDDPRGWRRKITSELLTPMGVKVYDPLIKPSWLPAAAQSGPSIFRNAIECGVYGEISPKHDEMFDDGIRTIRKIDLRFAHDCNFMICSLPRTFTAGTFEEIAVAANAGKPILMHMPDGVITTWLPAQIASSIAEYKQCHFGGWESLYEFLREVDAGSRCVDNYKWIFMSYHNDPKVRKELHELPSDRQD